MRIHNAAVDGKDSVVLEWIDAREAGAVDARERRREVSLLMSAAAWGPEGTI